MSMSDLDQVSRTNRLKMFGIVDLDPLASFYSLVTTPTHLFGSVSGGTFFRYNLSTGYAIAFSAGVPAGTNYAIAVGANNRIFLTNTTAGLYYSDDNGVTWNLSLALVSCSHVAAKPNGTIICSTAAAGATVRYSLDNGATWNVGPAMAGALNNSSVQQLAYLPVSGMFARVAAGGNIAYSSDGIAWTQYVNGTVGDVRCVCEFESRVFVGTNASALYYSSNFFNPAATFAQFPAFFNQSSGTATTDYSYEGLFVSSQNILYSTQRYACQYSQDFGSPMAPVQIPAAVIFIPSIVEFNNNIWTAGGDILFKTLDA